MAQLYDLNSSVRREMLGSTITKNGVTECVSGSVMRDGVCVASETRDVACLPGWTKSGSVCVKSAKEFQDAMENDPTVVEKRAASELRSTGFTAVEQRAYLQEAATGAFESHSSLNVFFIVIGIIIFILPMILYFILRTNERAKLTLASPLSKKKKKHA